MLRGISRESRLALLFCLALIVFVGILLVIKTGHDSDVWYNAPCNNFKNSTIDKTPDRCIKYYEEEQKT